MYPILPDTSYHIFNHANGFENIFRHEANYYFFLEKYWKYIGPIAETYAWCLMPNHFHLVVRIRKRAVLERNFGKVSDVDNRRMVKDRYGNKIDSENFTKVVSGEVSDADIEKYLSKQFANLFSSYTQSFNKVYGRRGSLFIKNFKREPIMCKNYFLAAIIYTNRNPVHHGFCKRMEDWPYSSYSEFMNEKGNRTEIQKLLKMTGGPESFLKIHQQALEKIDTSTFPDIPLLL